jgi:hypothetical protein
MTVNKITADRLIVGMAATSVAVPTLLALAGALASRKEIVGNLTFGIVAGGILVSLAFLVASWSASPKVKYPQLAWWALILISVAVLIYRFTQIGKDVDIAVIILMLALTFPLGLICLIAFSFQAIDSLSSMLMFCFLFTAVGYFQWFVVVPKLVYRSD